MTQPTLTDGTLVIDKPVDPFRKEEEATAQQFAAPEEPGMTPAEAKAAQAALLDASVEETVRKQQHQLMSEEVKFAYQQRLAKTFATSGYFDDLKGGAGPMQIGRAIVKIQLGEAMGLNPMESMQSVNVIKGRPTIDSHVRAARMKRYGYTWEIRRHDLKGCTIALSYKGQGLVDRRDKEGNVVLGKDGNPIKDPAIIEFLEEDAKRASLLEKDNWKAYPRNMYWARAITNAQRWYAPEVLNGSSILDPSEVDEASRTPEPAKPLFAPKESAA